MALAQDARKVPVRFKQRVIARSPSQGEQLRVQCFRVDIGSASRKPLPDIRHVAIEEMVGICIGAANVSL
jgi:hypothetical protein